MTAVTITRTRMGVAATTGRMAAVTSTRAARDGGHIAQLCLCSLEVFPKIVARFCRWHKLRHAQVVP